MSHVHNVTTYMTLHNTLQVNVAVCRSTHQEVTLVVEFFPLVVLVNVNVGVFPLNNDLSLHLCRVVHYIHHSVKECVCKVR